MTDKTHNINFHNANNLQLSDQYQQLFNKMDLAPELSRIGACMVQERSKINCPEWCNNDLSVHSLALATRELLNIYG